MKYLQAKLKEPIFAAVQLSDRADFNSAPLEAASIIEQQKRDLTHEIKTALHERIATLHLDDIVFEFVNKP